MTPGSFHAQTSGGTPIQYHDADGFTGPLAEMLNAEFVRAPGRTHTPLALLAAEMLEKLIPGVVIADLVYEPLGDVDLETAVP